MYLNILKKDLKRKKTMNAILLTFITLAALFVSSSVSNILTVMSGTDYYFEKSGMSDYIALKMGSSDNDKLTDILENSSDVKSYEIENLIFASKNNYTFNGKKFEDEMNTSVIMSIDEAKLNYFDKNDKIISDIEKGKVYIGCDGMKKCGIKTGDTIEISYGNTRVTLEVAGSCKDALLGSGFMGNIRFLLNDEDYKKISEDNSMKNSPYIGQAIYIYADNTDAVEKVFSDVDNIVFSGEKSLIKMCYVMDMIVAAILLVASVCLILISFTVLRFTVNFNISEEFREIGVMKAIGIPNRKIRMLYVVKYFAISLVGSAVGGIISIPFGKMLIKSVSEKMVLGNSGGIFVNIISAAAVMLIVLMFSYYCTGRIKKSTPLDAIRNGQTGERFRKKGRLHLEKGRLSACTFTALNDVVSSPKRFITLIITFMLCLCLVLIMVITSSTLGSEKLVPLFGTTQSDAYYSNSSDQMEAICPGGNKIMEQKLREIEKKLADNGMPAKCHVEVQYTYTLSFNGNSFKTACQQGIGGIKASDYVYYEGTAPVNKNEIAVSKVVADKLGAKIGDTVKLMKNDGEEEMLITGYIQTMNRLGSCIRLNENFDNGSSQMSSSFDYQIDFTDNPDKKEVSERIKKMKDIFDTNEIRSAAEFSASCTGVADIINSVKWCMLVITFVITALVTMLMERSFIAKEHSEIALLKAIGFRSSAVIKIHTLRFSFVGIAASILAAAITPVLTKVAITPIFGMMGAENIDFDYNPLLTFTVYPLMVLALTVISAFLTAQYTRTIAASETSNIE